jgi:CubicO group peptidase (beta-lactamase class C family)
MPGDVLTQGGHMRIARLALLSAFLLSGFVQAQGLPRAWSPERAGFSSERLARLGAALNAGVEKGEIPGAVVLVARKGSIAYFESFGFRDREAKAPMGRDSIFRIHSMTKPIVTVGAMILVEEGRLALGEPVSRYLPEFKDVKVGVEKKDASGKIELVLETPRRPMTVQDLMRHTSGLTYGQFGARTLVKEQYVQAKLADPSQTNADFVAKLAKLPLQNHPGAVWDYSQSTDVLGRIIEVISGMELQQFLMERVFKPLGMPDTGFWVEQASQHARIAEAQADPASGKRPAAADKTKRNWQAGGGGMVSTAADYARFCQMLLNGGTLDGARILSRKTVEYMTADHMPPGARIDAFPIAVIDTRPENGQSFGLGFAVRVSAGRSAIPGSVGDYSWVGAGGPQFWVDPKEEIVAILNFYAPGSSNGAARVKYWTLMRNLVYQALEN